MVYLYCRFPKEKKRKILIFSVLFILDFIFVTVYLFPGCVLLVLHRVGWGEEYHSARPVKSHAAGECCRPHKSSGGYREAVDVLCVLQGREVSVCLCVHQERQYLHFI